VLLLSNNPGYTEKGLALRQRPDFVARMRQNLRHEPSEYPFIYLDPKFEDGSGSRWWQKKLKHLLKEFEKLEVSRSILNVPYFPYPSSRFGHRSLRLPSQEYSRHLVRQAMKRKAVIVFMRKGKGWLEDLPKLQTYARSYMVKNPQNPTISPKNLGEKGFAAVVRAIKKRLA
jgi:hypothetical protein